MADGSVCIKDGATVRALTTKRALSISKNPIVGAHAAHKRKIGPKIGPYIGPYRALSRGYNRGLLLPRYGPLVAKSTSPFLFCAQDFDP